MEMKNLNCLLASLIVFAPLLAAEAAPTQAKIATKKLIRQAPSTDAAAGQAYSARLWNRILSQWNYPDGKQSCHSNCGGCGRRQC
jgi:hypothetical protein